MPEPTIRVVSFVESYALYHTTLPYFMEAWHENSGIDAERCRFTFIYPQQTEAEDLPAADTLSTRYAIDYRRTSAAAMAAYRDYWTFSFAEMEFDEDIVVYCLPQVLVSNGIADLVAEAYASDCLIADPLDAEARHGADTSPANAENDDQPLSALRFLCMPRRVRAQLRNALAPALACTGFAQGAAPSYDELNSVLRCAFARVVREQAIACRLIAPGRIVSLAGSTAQRWTLAHLDAVSLFVITDAPAQRPNWSAIFWSPLDVELFLERSDLNDATLLYQRNLRRMHSAMAVRAREAGDLFARAHDPYYIFATDFTQTSAGIRSLHSLCHALNELGLEAYLIGAAQTAPSLRTPLLDRNILRQHFRAGLTPIAVLPEVISGNPFRTPLVARWLLNLPGHLAGEQSFADDEVVFAYDSWCLPPGMHGDLLSLPSVDPHLFNNDNNPFDDKRTLRCYYAHKSLAFGEEIRSEHRNLTSLCHDVKLSREELASILRRSQVLYCYEQSAIIHEARACGCPVLLVPSSYWPLTGEAACEPGVTQVHAPQLREPGIGLSVDPQGLEQARKSLRDYPALSRQWHTLSWKCIRQFVTLTQEKNRKRVARQRSEPAAGQASRLEDLWCTPHAERPATESAFLSAAAEFLPFVRSGDVTPEPFADFIKWLHESLAPMHPASTPIAAPSAPADGTALSTGEESALFSQLDEMIRAGSDDAALILMEEMTRRGTGLWQVYDRLGGYYAEQGRLDEAGDMLARGSAREAVSTNCLRKLAAVHALRDDFGRILATCAQILKREPDDSEMHFFVRDVLVASAPGLGDLFRPEARNSTPDPELQTLRDRERRTGELHAAILARAAALLGGGALPGDASGASTETKAEKDYRTWIDKRRLQDIDTQYFAEHVKTLWKRHLLFEFIVVLQPGQESFLADTIDSLAAQYFDGWRLSIFAQVPSPDPEFENDTSKVRWIDVGPDDSPVAAINRNISRSNADWLGLFACGTCFSPQLLLLCADYCATRPDWRLIYTDDDLIDSEGQRRSPHFKPDVNPDLLRSTDYIGSGFVARDTLIASGGYPSCPGGERYAIALRVLDAHGEAAIGHIPDLLCHLPASLPAQASDAPAMAALHEHFARNHIDADIGAGLIPGLTRRINYRHQSTPKVSIIIAVKNRLDLLGPCVENLLSRTRYPDWEILIVDSASDNPDLPAYYQALAQALAGRVTILDAPGEFNLSASNNLAAQAARGDFLLLLGNDALVVDADWLDVMMSHAQRPEVAIVGARLQHPEGKGRQHAGMILGMNGNAGNVFSGETSAELGDYPLRALVDQNCSAVSGTCLLVRKSLYETVGGMDEMTFADSNADVDLCLKIGQLGYRIVWTPFATLLQNASPAPAADSAEVQQQRASRQQQQAHQLARRWLPQLANDPAWNRHLSLSSTSPQVEDDLVVSWNPDFRDRPRLLWMPLASPGQAEYRSLGPLRALHARGMAQCSAICQPAPGYDRAPTPIELARLAPDTLIMHAPVDDVRLIGLLHYREINTDVLRVYSLDDLITDIPAGSYVHKKLPATLMRERLRLGLAASDRLIVSSEPLADACREMIADIRILPNTLDWSVWGTLSTTRRRGEKLRVGWAGAQQHGADLQFMLEVVKATSAEVDWIFFGMMPNGAAPYVKEFHDFVHRFADYPQKLASLDLDLAVAPLEIHPFNEAKSNLRLLEYGALGWPVMCTDIFPYRTGKPPVTCLPNDAARWIEALRARIGEYDALAREGDTLRAWVKRGYLLENNLDRWLQALTR